MRLDRVSDSSYILFKEKSSGKFQKIQKTYWSNRSVEDNEYNKDKEENR